MKGEIIMAIEFKNLNLEVLDITTNATPDIYINVNGITFTKRVLDDLGYPQFVQYAVDKDNKVFAIRACKGNESRAVPFSKPRNEQKNTLSTSNKNITDIVRALMGDEWKDDCRYRVQGYYIANEKTIIFELAEGTECNYRPNKDGE